MKAPAYPVREAGGLVWGYVGPKEQEPAFQAYEFFEGPDENRCIFRVNTPANFLQLYEGGTDSSHVGILHCNLANPEWKNKASFVPEAEDYTSVALAVGDNAPDIDLENTPFGFHYAAKREGPADPDGTRQDSVRVTAVIFPTGRIIPLAQYQFFVFEVPQDDFKTSTYIVAHGPKPFDRKKMRAVLGLDNERLWNETRLRIYREPRKPFRAGRRAHERDLVGTGRAGAGGRQHRRLDGGDRRASQGNAGAGGFRRGAFARAIAGVAAAASGRAAADRCDDCRLFKGAQSRRHESFERKALAGPVAQQHGPDEKIRHARDGVGRRRTKRHLDGMTTSGEGIGQPVRRKEDMRLLTGRGTFSDDFNLPGQAYAVMVRSPHAHARIVRFDTTAASVVPGVVAIITGADADVMALGSIAPDHSMMGPAEARRRAPDIFPENRDGSDWYTSPYLPLPADRARFVGEPVAMVIAETIEIAREAAERVGVDYEPLDAVTAAIIAAEPVAPLLWEERTTNVGLDADIGDAAKTAAAFAGAAHIVSLKTWVQRVTGVPMEPRAAVGDYDAATGRYTLYAGSGGIQRQRREIASILGISQDLMRVVTQDIGGNFGTRNGLFPEFPLVVFAARKVGRPVKWTCERTRVISQRSSRPRSCGRCRTRAR